MPAPTGISLQGKFFLITFLGIVLLSASLGYLATSRSSHLIYAGVEKQGKILAQTVAALIINELVYEKLGLVEEGGLIDNYVREIYGRRDLDFIYVAVLDEGARVISHSDFNYYGTVINNEFTRQASQSGEVSINQIRTDDGPALEFAAPLAIAGKRWGLLLFSVSLREVGHEASLIARQIIMVMVGALLVGLALIVLLGRRFITPITEMAKAMQEIDSELPDCRVEVRGNDELAVLARNFNTMITRIREANLATRQAHAKLLQSEKLATLGILSSSVAHRINNPLGGIFNCLRMLEQHGDQADFRTRYIGLIREGLESIRETVSRLLWTAGRRRGNETRAVAAEVFHGIMRFLDFRLRNADITLQTAITSELVLPVEPHDLQEILQNILVNAVQAMPGGGTLQVEMKREGRHFVIRISDSGPGVPDDEQDRIFELFYTTKAEGEGTGLGLWMSQELVKKYQGDIRLECPPGQGTIVTITIPEA